MMLNKLHTLTDSSPLRFGIALGYTLFVVIILVQPTHQPVIDLHLSQETPSLMSQLWFGVGHMLLFALMVLVWAFSFYQRLPLQAAVTLAFCIALLFGVGTEIGQLIVSARDPSLFDLMTDGLGAALSVITLYVVLQNR
jgi:VanZ family protein